MASTHYKCTQAEIDFTIYTVCTAYCHICSLDGQQSKGVSGKTDSWNFLQECDIITNKVMSWAKVGQQTVSPYEPYTDDVVDSTEVPASQSGMQRFITLKDEMVSTGSPKQSQGSW